jgi:hypothetical protein
VEHIRARSREYKNIIKMEYNPPSPEGLTRWGRHDIVIFSISSADAMWAGGGKAGKRPLGNVHLILHEYAVH